jgi:S1-C subfamily serine protease
MVGEDVVVVGHPYGYINTVSTGIISAVGREITMPSGEVLTDLIQTNASINPGNSGGPVFKSKAS